MTFVTILNIVLAVAVIGGIVRLLDWAIISSHREPAPVVAVDPALPRPHALATTSSAGHALIAREQFEPVTG